MIPMRALVGFSDRALATDLNPSGGFGPGALLLAPNPEIAKRLADAGLAERTKTDTPAKSAPDKA